MSTYPHTARPLIDRPCPPWCEDEPGHGWDSIENATGRQLRTHCRTLGTYADLSLTEYADEPAPCEPVRVWVTVDSDAMSASEVRRIAAELLNAADELDKVTGGATV